MTGSPLQDANRLRTLVSALFRREGAGRTARALFSHILISRFLLMVLFLFAALALFGLDQVSLYAFITLAFVVNIPFTLWLRDESKRQRLGPLQFVTDVIVITGVVHFTGGINSHFTLLYPLAILTAGVVESGRLALKVAVLSILLYSTLIVLETSGVLIYRGPEPFPYAGIDHVYQQLMVRILIFTFFAAASSYLADRCFYQNHQMQRLRLVVEFIFNNVSIALLAVGRDGKVLVANTAAQELFGMSGRDIQQRSFPDFFADRQVPDLEDDHQRGRVWKMVGQDGEVFPAAFEASLSRFPIPEAGDTFVEDRECFVVAIQDLTEMLRLQQQARESVRLKTAMDIASEVGHWIRNPLTALQLAIDFVNSTFAANSSSGESLSEDELAAVCGMCEVIAEETRQLREKMDDFLRCADRDHARFLDMMAEAETWAGRLATSPGEESNG